LLLVKEYQYDDTKRPEFPVFLPNFFAGLTYMDLIKKTTSRF